MEWYSLLVVAQVVGLLIIPLGLPGTWLQVLALAGYGYVTDFRTVGLFSIVFAVLIAAVAEVVEFSMGARYAQKYGGGPRAAWGAIIGGVVGAIIGVPIFLIGPVLGAFVGSFVGAALFELSHSWRSPEWRAAMKVGWGAFLGRLAATAMKCGIGVAIAAIALLSALR
jgi:uncharacterized protein YqgC (DUF456 family)